MSEPGVSRVVLMTSAQVGKTEMLNNLVGFHVSHDPSPILVLQPTLDMAETWSKDRLAPMLRDTECLKGLVEDAKSRDSGNTILHKNFPGGHVTVVGANSPSSLASRPIRIVLADEIDRYPPSAGTEGDPLSLAIKRTATFWNRRVMVVSTPTRKGFSRIEEEWILSDQRRYLVPCKHCGEPQFLDWQQVQWEEGKPETAFYSCAECGSIWSEADRLWGVANGKWMPTNDRHGHHVGFHLNELYSPWSKIPDIAVSYVIAQRKVETKKTWTNTVLGEPYEEEGEIIDHHALANRGEPYTTETAPLQVLTVTCGVDVQANRLEIERVGWGVDEESWSLDHHILYGDPSDPGLWQQLDAYLRQPSIRADGREMPVRTTCIDSGGHHTQQVYKFCRLRRNRRIFAIKGREDPKTVWPPNNQLKKAKQKDAIIVGVTAAKDVLYAQLKLQEEGPGYCHFPIGRPLVWFEQLTAEAVQTKYVRGFPKRFYQLPEGRRNEALDCRVYAYAALQSMAIRWGTELKAHAPRATSPQEIPRRPVEPPPVRLEPSVAAQAMQIARPPEVAASPGSPAPALARPPVRSSGGFLRQGSRSGGWLNRR